jgi:hypothetical protein
MAIYLSKPCNIVSADGMSIGFTGILLKLDIKLLFPDSSKRLLPENACPIDETESSNPGFGSRKSLDKDKEGIKNKAIRLILFKILFIKTP